MPVKKWINESVRNDIISVMSRAHISIWKSLSENKRELADETGPRKIVIGNLIEKLNAKEDLPALLLEAKNLLKESQDFVEQRVLDALILAFNVYLNKEQREEILHRESSVGREARRIMLNGTNDLSTIMQVVQRVDSGAASREVIEMAAHTLKNLLLEQALEEFKKELEASNQVAIPQEPALLIVAEQPHPALPVAIVDQGPPEAAPPPIQPAALAIEEPTTALPVVAQPLPLIPAIDTGNTEVKSTVSRRPVR